MKQNPRTNPITQIFPNTKHSSETWNYRSSSFEIGSFECALYNALKYIWESIKAPFEGHKKYLHNPSGSFACINHREGDVVEISIEKAFTMIFSIPLFIKTSLFSRTHTFFCGKICLGKMLFSFRGVCSFECRFIYWHVSVACVWIKFCFDVCICFAIGIRAVDFVLKIIRNCKMEVWCFPFIKLIRIYN